MSISWSTCSTKRCNRNLGLWCQVSLWPPLGHLACSLPQKLGNCFSRWQNLGIRKKKLHGHPWQNPPTIPIPTFDSKSLRTEGVAWIQVLLPSDKMKLHSFVSRLHPTSVESRWPPSWGFMWKNQDINETKRGWGVGVLFWNRGKRVESWHMCCFFWVEIFHINFWSETIGVHFCSGV